MISILQQTVSENRTLFLVLLGAFMVRMAAGLLLVDLEEAYYWEYGEIAKNLNTGKGYSLYHFDGGVPTIKYSEGSSPAPSAFMPPGYVVVIWAFLQIEDPVMRNLLLMTLQSFFGVIVVLLVFKLTYKYFDPRAAFLASLIAGFLPEFVYASTSFTPTVFFHLGIMALILSTYEFCSSPTKGQIIMIAFLSSSLIYLRPESLLYIFFLIAFLGWKVGSRRALLISSIIALTLLPWQVRNFLVFDSFVPITTSSGLNLFRGNNDVQVGAWFDQNVTREIREINQDYQFEVNLNKLYLRHALNFMVEHPQKLISNLAYKFHSFWIWSPDDERSQHPLYFIPWLFLLLGSILGLRQLQPRKYTIVFGYLAACTIVALIFFVLPRYQTMMKIASVPFAAVGLSYLYSWLRLKLAKIRN